MWLFQGCISGHKSLPATLGAELIFAPRFKNVPLDTVREGIDSGGLGGFIRIFGDGGVLLASVRLPYPVAPVASFGTLTFNPIAPLPVTTTGLLSHFEVTNSEGWLVFSGDPDKHLGIKALSLTAGQTVSIPNIILYQGITTPDTTVNTTFYPFFFRDNMQVLPPTLGGTNYVLSSPEDGFTVGLPTLGGTNSLNSVLITHTVAAPDEFNVGVPTLGGTNTLATVLITHTVAAPDEFNVGVPTLGGTNTLATALITHTVAAPDEFNVALPTLGGTNTLA